MPHVLNALTLGLLSNEPTLRDVEEMTRELGPWSRTLVPAPISDTTLDTEARRLSEPYLTDKLIGQVRDMKRSKMLVPFGLPCGVATVDGKNLATLEHDAGGRAQARTSDNAKWHKAEKSPPPKPYYLVPVLRAVLTSAAAKPALLQLALGARQGEAAAFDEMVAALHSAYGRSQMIDIIDRDAGMTSLRNANAVDMRGIENTIGCWSHLRQTWLVRQETRLNDGTIVDIEDRFFISSVLWNYLKPEQILTLVRNHWGIENDAFNSLDLQWHEDHGPWCSQGNAVWTLGLLRLMAYNLVQYLRKRRLRRKDEHGRWRDPPPWRRGFRKIRRALDCATIETMAISTGG